MAPSICCDIRPIPLTKPENPLALGMISHELKAQATLAYQNWKMRNPDLVPPVSEEAFVLKFEELQATFNRGLLQRSEFDQRIDDLLRNPGMALSVSHFTPQERPTASLLRELEQLKKQGILNDEEFETRKGELFFQRGVEEGQPLADASDAPASETPAQLRTRLAGYLEELLRNGVMSHAEYAMAQQRLKG
jgi:Short C-terminal domain